MRSERWNTVNEIKRRFHETTDPKVGAGPVVYVENGKKYSDDSESHIAVIGRTGTGKSQCCSLPFMREVLQKGESLIMLDPKGESYKKNACYIPAKYQVFCIDFRNPRKSPTKWNPLSTPYRLFRSKDPDDNDIASSMLSELWNGVYPYDGHSDRFWTDASVNYAKGLSYGLFEEAEKSYINLNSVAVMMEQSEIHMGSSTLLKAFYDHLPIDSLAKRNLATYATAPNETRGSIHSVAASGLEVFSRSKGLMEMLSQDTLNIMEINVDRPFALIIITPDETDVYDALSGLLISQVSQHLIRVAQDRGGQLPIRVNIILEELGSVGRSIPNLPNLMVACRSRNMRLMLVLQSNAQLEDVYGKSKAETINSCIGITIGFSTNSWGTLNEWAQRCGERYMEKDGHMLKEPLITASQLAAMPIGTALVLVDSQYKFVSRIPFYNELYDNSDWKAPQSRLKLGKKRVKTKLFDFKDLIGTILKKQMDALSSDSEHKFQVPAPPRAAIPTGNSKNEHRVDVSNLFSKIDAKIAELEAAEDAEREQKAVDKKYHVIIVGTLGSKMGSRLEMAELINSVTKEGVGKAGVRLTNFPVDIAFATKKEALEFAGKITKAGGKVKLKMPQ